MDDKERKTARLAMLVDFNLLEVKNTQLQIQFLKLREEDGKKRRYKGGDATEVVRFETGFSDDQNLANGRTWCRS